MTRRRLLTIRLTHEEAADLAQVRLCDRALRGSVRAIHECRRVLAAAAAME